MNRTILITGRGPLFVVSCVFLAMLGCNSLSLGASKKSMQQFEKIGQLQLSLSDCLLIAMQRNFDILMTQEALIQADAKITQVKPAKRSSAGVSSIFLNRVVLGVSNQVGLQPEFTILFEFLGIEHVRIRLSNFSTFTAPLP